MLHFPLQFYLFYSYLKTGNLDSAAALCGGNAPPKDAQVLLVKLKGMYGSLKETTFDGGKSSVTIVNKNLDGEIDLKYKVKYEKSSNTEDFALKFIHDSLRITGYHSALQEE